MTSEVFIKEVQKLNYKLEDTENNFIITNEFGDWVCGVDKLEENELWLDAFEFKGRRAANLLLAVSMYATTPIKCR